MNNTLVIIISLSSIRIECKFPTDDLLPVSNDMSTKNVINPQLQHPLTNHFGDASSHHHQNINNHMSSATRYLLSNRANGVSQKATKVQQQQQQQQIKPQQIPPTNVEYSTEAEKVQSSRPRLEASKVRYNTVFI
jgi:uncharacterized membrane-anchored protein YhcB (DUF1043 family)